MRLLRERAAADGVALQQFAKPPDTIFVGITLALGERKLPTES